MGWGHKGGVRGDWVGGVYWGVGVGIRGVAGLGWLGVRPHPNPPPEGEGVIDKDGVGNIGGARGRIRGDWVGGVYWGVGVEIRGRLGWDGMGVRPHPNPPPEGEGIIDKDG